MGRSLSVIVGTIPDGPAPSGMVVDGAGLTDAPTAALASARPLVESVGVADEIAAILGYDRDSLIYGTYEPSLATAGIMVAESNLDEYNSSTTDRVTIPAGAAISDKIIYGDASFAGAAELHNCLLVGGNDSLSSGNLGVVRATATRTGIAKLYDCTIRPRRESDGRDCALGWQYELHRCHLSGGVDGAGIYSLASPWSAQVKVMGCLIEDLAYTYPDRDHDDGTHNDCVQIQGGRDIEIVGNAIRGTAHRMTGSGSYYPTHASDSKGDWPLTKTPQVIPGSGIIIQNNVGAAAFDNSVIIRGNYFRRCKAQLLVKSTANGFVCDSNRFSAVDPPVSNANGTVYEGVTLAFTYNPYWIRFDNVASSGAIAGLTSGGAVSNTTNIWMDGGNAGSSLATPRSSGISPADV